MSTDFHVTRRSFLSNSTRLAGVTAAIGIAPQFIRPGRAFGADKLAAGMIGGPTGFDGANTPESRAFNQRTLGSRGRQQTASRRSVTISH